MEKLFELERKKLIVQHRKEQDKRVCDRIKAALLTTMVILIQKLRLLLLDDESIRRHIKAYWIDKN